MKRLWIALALLALCTAMCIGEQVYIKSFCRELDTLAATAQRDMSEESLEALHKCWSEKNDLLYAMCQHSTLDSISVSVHELRSSRDKEKIKDALTDVRAQNRTFYENQRISFSNIA